jgi:hypothetical protein
VGTAITFFMVGPRRWVEPPEGADYTRGRGWRRVENAPIDAFCAQACGVRDAARPMGQLGQCELSTTRRVRAFLFPILTARPGSLAAVIEQPSTGPRAASQTRSSAA